MTPPRAIPLYAVLAWALVSGAGLAQAPDAPADGCDAPPPAHAVAPDWQRVLAPDAGFVLDLPPGTSLAASENIWYVMLHDAEGRAELPGMDVTRHAGRTLQEALDELWFPEDAVATPLTLGPGTRGLCVAATYETDFEGRYPATTYLAEGDGAVYVMRRWENLVWEPYHAVARSFTRVRDAGPFPPEE